MGTASGSQSGGRKHGRNGLPRWLLFLWNIFTMNRASGKQILQSVLASLCLVSLPLKCFPWLRWCRAVERFHHRQRTHLRYKRPIYSFGCDQPLSRLPTDYLCESFTDWGTLGFSWTARHQSVWKTGCCVNHRPSVMLQTVDKYVASDASITCWLDKYP